MKNCLLISFLLILAGQLFSQKFEIETYQKTPESFLHLLKSNDEISKNDTLNELLVDLVMPTLADSLI